MDVGIVAIKDLFIQTLHCDNFTNEKTMPLSMEGISIKNLQDAEL